MQAITGWLLHDRLVRVSTTKAPNTLTLNQTTTSFQLSNASGAASVGAPTLTSAPYRVSVSQSVASSNDLDGSAIPTSTTGYQSDAFGNTTQIVVSTRDGFSKNPPIRMRMTQRFGCWGG